MWANRLIHGRKRYWRCLIIAFPRKEQKKISFHYQRFLAFVSRACRWYISLSVDRVPGGVLDADLTPAQWVDRVYPTLSDEDLDILAECTLEPGTYPWLE